MCNIVKTHFERNNDGNTFFVVMTTRCTRMSIFGGEQEVVSFTVFLPEDDVPFGCKHTFLTCFATKIPAEYKQGCSHSNFGSQEFNEREVITISCLI